jgi:hypothetical protein
MPSQRLRNRFLTLVFLVIAVVAMIGVYVCSLLVLAHPQASGWIYRFSSIGDHPVWLFDPTSEQHDPSSRSLALATALVGSLSWALARSGRSFSFRILAVLIVAVSVAWLMPQRLFGPSVYYFILFFVIQSLAVFALSVASNTRERASANTGRFTILELLMLTMLVAIACVSWQHFAQIVSYHQIGPHMPPANRIGSRFNWWLLLLGMVAGVNSVAWMAPADAVRGRWLLRVGSAIVFAATAGYVIALWYGASELFWPPNRAYSRKVLHYGYHGYIYWLVWQGIFQLITCWCIRYVHARYNDEWINASRHCFTALLRRGVEAEQ